MTHFFRNKNKKIKNENYENSVALNLQKMADKKNKNMKIFKINFESYAFSASCVLTI